ncbi:MAG: histidine ammonia-lyase, partial [Sediminibacterium sp.]|nr:histidine ammonia-lyase [Sediminibacterium sp.]
MCKKYIHISNEPINFNTIAAFLQNKFDLILSEESIIKIQQCREFVENKIYTKSDLYYGINTGFGYLQNVAIDNTDLEQLQYNLLVSHACGVGEEVPKPIVALMLFLKIKSLSLGYSGVTLDTIQRLIDLYNNQCLPIIYTQGSLGASGDLAPLSHLSLPLIGLGKVHFNGQKIESKDALKQLNLLPLQLKSKEGLALINGTQFMSSYGVYIIHLGEKLLQWGNIIAAFSLIAFDASTSPFNVLIHAVRKHLGQFKTAQHILNLLENYSPINQNKNVQDPYSFRCIPQVHGASLDALQIAKNVFEIEINSVTDNPIIFFEEDTILSGGNFHGQPLALQLDFLCIAFSEVGNISERRTYQLISGQRNLPIFLTEKSGLNSGFMIPQYTAASMVSENKQLSTPASVDSISSSNNQEDHVSMGANAATKCLKIVNNVHKILAIELLTAMQAIDFKKETTLPSNLLKMY